MNDAPLLAAAHDPAVPLRPAPAARLPAPSAGRGKGEPWVQVTLCLIVASLMLVIAKPDPAPRGERVLGEEALLVRRALGELRGAIAGYRLDHGVWPGLAPGAWAQGCDSASAEWLERQLLRATDPAGDEVDASDARIFGPYLRSALPANPRNGLATVRILAPGEPWPDPPDGSTGWIYRPETGEVRANCPDAVPGDGIRYDQI